MLNKKEIKKTDKQTIRKRIAQLIDNDITKRNNEITSSDKYINFRQHLLDTDKLFKEIVGWSNKEKVTSDKYKAEYKKIQEKVKKYREKTSKDICCTPNPTFGWSLSFDPLYCCYSMPSKDFNVLEKNYLKKEKRRQFPQWERASDFHSILDCYMITIKISGTGIDTAEKAYKDLKDRLIVKESV